MPNYYEFVLGWKLRKYSRNSLFFKHLSHYYLKGMLTDFTWFKSTEPTPAQKNDLLKKLLIFPVPVTVTADLVLSRIGPKWPTSNSKGAI